MYRTPGVHLEEIAKLPPSIVAPATAIPAFVGYTQRANEARNGAPLATGTDLTNTPTRITSLIEFEQIFGTTAAQAVNVTVRQTLTIEAPVDPNANPPAPIVETGSTQPVVSMTAPLAAPTHYLYYAVRMYFANRGGPCYIVSLGNLPALQTATPADFTAGIDLLQSFDEPTLVLCPDAVLLGTGAHDVAVHALSHCREMKDRFAILDVEDAVSGGNDNLQAIDDGFRTNMPQGVDVRKYGAAYFPYLETSIPLVLSDELTTITHTVSLTTGNPNDTPTDADGAFHTRKLDGIQDARSIYSAIKTFLRREATVTMPPSGAIAGVYARVDRERGVWKAPANESVVGARRPAVPITNDMNDRLNVDAQGRSINVVRHFSGKGTLVWGARTLAGNDNEWRFISVRRYFNMVEQAATSAAEQFVFEPNDRNTWIKVKSMIESFLTRQWREGALAGAKPEHAFYVAVGLNETMSSQDVLEGRLIVEIGLAVVRPAEFIVLRFSHMLQTS